MMWSGRLDNVASDDDRIIFVRNVTQLSRKK